MNLQGKAKEFKGNKLCIGDYISLFAEDLFGFAWLFPSLTAPLTLLVPLSLRTHQRLRDGLLSTLLFILHQCRLLRWHDAELHLHRQDSHAFQSHHSDILAHFATES